jgi:hypothetical protein
MPITYEKESAGAAHATLWVTANIEHTLQQKEPSVASEYSTGPPTY